MLAVTCYKVGHEGVNEEPLSRDKDWKEQQKQRESQDLTPHLGESVLMMVQWILAGTLSLRRFLKIIAFYDPGSSCSLISNSLAELLDLLGQPITITLHTVNGARQLLTKYYELYTGTHQHR